MNYQIMKFVQGLVCKKRSIFFLAAAFWCLSAVDVTLAQSVKWLSVSDLLSPVNSVAANYEGEYGAVTQGNYGNSFTWPAQYGYGLNDQDMLRMEGVWVGAKDYSDPVAGKILTPKVVSSGPRNDADRVNEVFPVQFTLIGKRPHPNVTVISGGSPADASFQTSYDQVDEYDPTMAADRMILVKFNTSLGITVTRKVMVFANTNDGTYYINDWVFKNTGIYDPAGDIKQQTLDSVFVYFVYRYAFAGEGNGAASETLGGLQSTSTWASFQSTWGLSTLNHDFGNYGVGAQAFGDPSSPLYQMRGFYAYYGPDTYRPVTYDEDWGCPAQTSNGQMCSWKFAGNVTLHADKTAHDSSDDISQPTTTWFISSDLNPDVEAVNQYDVAGMADRWTDMSEGHSPIPHDSSVIVVVGGSTPYPGTYPLGRRNSGGGTSQGQGFGPYANLAPGDSIHIVFAQGAGGMSREKELEVGANWVQYYKGTGTPVLNMPDGSQAPPTLDGANAYKKAWVFTGKDSIIKIYREAMNNYASGYKAPQPPQPPSNFIVSGLGDRINLQWSEEAESDAHFNGYVIYRSEGTSMNPLAKYDKVFECDKNSLPSEVSGMRSWDDNSGNDPNPPARGFDYYYYLQTKDDGTQIKDPLTQQPEVLYSSLELTITVLPASLARPAIPAALSFGDNKWVVMDSLGAWAAGVKYGKSDSLRMADWVTYNGSNYVYVYQDSLISLTATNPATADSIWERVTSKGTWVSGRQYNADDYVTYYDATSHRTGTYFTPFFISGGQGLPFTFSTMKWIAMNKRGAWSSGINYGKNDSLAVADWVTASDGLNYVYVYSDSLKSSSATEPGTVIGDSVWKKVTSKGEWAPGVRYDAYDFITHDLSTYFTPFQISGGQGLDLVRVVPNPYDSRARSLQFGTKIEEQDKIKFYGLPAACQLKIFTERGDLIYLINHAGSGDETWYCTTSSGQIVASGIYILAVEEPNGQKIFRKFVIIR